MSKRDAVLGGLGQQPRKGFFGRPQRLEPEEVLALSFETVDDIPADQYDEEDVTTAEGLLSPFTTPERLLGTAALKYAESESANTWEETAALATQAGVLLQFAEVKLLAANQPSAPVPEAFFDL